MKSRLWGAISAGIVSLGMLTTANAALVSRLSGQAVYDTDLNVTWLANANLAASTTFGVAGINANGTMNWATANSWITAMNADGGAGYLGFNDWRLPITSQPDASCSDQSNQGAGFPLQGFGTGCTGSEMGHLFNVEGVTAAAPGLLFSNVQSVYWSTSSPSTGPVRSSSPVQSARGSSASATASRSSAVRTTAALRGLCARAMSARCRYPPLCGYSAVVCWD